MEEQAKGLLKRINEKKLEKNTKFLAVASGKGGVGKTNFAVNFSYILANDFNKKVLLIDADIGMANVHILVNVNTKKTLKDILNGEKIENIIFSTRGIDILPGFSGIDAINEVDDSSVLRFVQNLNDVSENYDYIIIDTAAGIDNKVISFIRASSKTYVITTPEPTAIMDAYALIKSMKKLYDYSDFKVVVNMAKSEEEGVDTFDRLKASINKFLNMDIKLAGILPATKNIQKTVKKKQIISEVYPSDKFVLQLKKIAAEELGEPPPPLKESFWEKVINFLKKD
ncbi:flagellar biosynthesis protein FlhG [Persephonella hydrogeniphila]|uniref:Flagellar biosynthesis protein FlhG n=1 Tax=Persephonella hydrogeniphila TaxID=198703 RepID=A0A285NFR6_9AQUI|nr:MinD/ParA family protein [Persephonella hydrogeniphila]SNZ08118.1 flagellar biosynthesis protein FlhG [Persephonella hydrogeniphila]